MMKDAFGVVSKIAMRPVYHGTTPSGAAKLKRYIRAKDPSKSSFQFYDVPGDTRARGLYTTTERSVAENFSPAGRDGGLKSSKGKVLMFNSVGVKPKYKGGWEETYDPKELGPPLSTTNINRRAYGRRFTKARNRSEMLPGTL